MEINRTAANVANHLGIFDAYAFLRRRLTGSQVAILMYHRVCPDEENQYLEALSVESFERQMEYFSRNYEIFSLDELVQHIVSGDFPSEKAVVVTFDDGYKDNYLYAYPILKKYHVPATIFLATGHIGSGKLFWWDEVGYIIQHSSIKQLNLEGLGSYCIESKIDKSRARFMITERLKKIEEGRKNLLIERLLNVCQVELPRDLGKKLILSWKEVKEMDNGTVTFGAHSVNHHILTSIPLEQAENEIVQSKKDIEEKLGKKISAFCYPDGAFNTEIAGLVKRSGFTCAVSIRPGRLISSKDSVYQLNRIRAREDFNKFKGALCGLWGDLRGHPRLAIHQ